MADSQQTDLSLLRRVARRDEPAWDDFAEIYGPMVYAWSRREGLQPDDARDVTQEVFQNVLAGLDNWSPGRFRSWLWTIFRRRAMDHYRSARNRPQAAGGSTANLRMQEIEEQPPDAASEIGCRELQDLRRRALKIIHDRINPNHWQAFYRTVIQGDAPVDVAADLGLSKWLVYKAKSRVLQQLRREFDGLDFVEAWEGVHRDQGGKSTDRSKSDR